MTEQRCTLELHLIGLAVADGEIPLAQLADISRYAQEFALRTARALVAAAGPGRTPRSVDSSAQLTLSAVTPGSTVLKLSGPERQDQLPLGGDEFADLSDRVFDAIGATFETLATGTPPTTSRPALESLSGLLRAAGRGGAQLEVITRVPGGRTRSASLAPTEAAALIDVSLPSEPPTVERVTLTGELYRVDTHTGMFRIEDDLGSSIEAVVTNELRAVARLVGTRVVVTGEAEVEPNGRVVKVLHAMVQPSESIEGLDVEAFRRPVDRNALLATAEPFDADSPGVEGVDADEIDAFLAAINS